MHFTEEQQQAIYETGHNIIVSAGAGSGKTAVLTERIIEKLKSGISLSELVVLTFTNAAAFEMKERVRKKLVKEVEAGNVALASQSDLLDTADICTFDSYSLALVKKYHYLLGLEKDVNICDSVMIESKKKELMDDVFRELFEEEDSCFLAFMDTFTLKSDQKMQTAMLSMYRKLETIQKKDEFLDTYASAHYNPSFEEKLIHDYTKVILREKDSMLRILVQMEDVIHNEVLRDWYEKLYTILEPLEHVNTYDEIVALLPKSLPSMTTSKKVEDEEKEEVKKYYDPLKKYYQAIKELCDYESAQSMIDEYRSTKESAKAVIKILKQFEEKLMALKKKYQVFEFSDITRFGVILFEKYPDIRKQYQSKIKEIMIDEYQDTNDIGDYFISLIANNNVYMVGDVKQSIYSFRNANPSLFMEKYKSYQDPNVGCKIDLMKNFRSRREVLSSINFLFERWMNERLGGVNYTEGHEMIFGNTSYEEKGACEVDHQLEVLDYAYLDRSYRKEEIEAFLIASDIAKKIKEHYPVFDMKEGKIRDLEYRDITILMDRKTNFDLYKKIFTYLQIPMNIHKEDGFVISDEIFVLHSILTILTCMQKKDYNSTTFRHHVMGLLRSFLFSYQDEEIFSMFLDAKEKNISFYQAWKERESLVEALSNIREVYQLLPTLSLEQLLRKILETFHFYEKLMTKTDVALTHAKMEYCLNLAQSLEKLGYDLPQFTDYFKTAYEEKIDVQFQMGKETQNAVQLMTIHKSKGLEFPLCYYSGLYKTFSKEDFKDRYLLNQTYGFVLPVWEEGLKDTILKTLVKEEYYEKDISEKIRLFYVATTRAKEKMIMVAPLQDYEQEIDDTTDANKLRYRSFLDMLISIKNALKPYCRSVSLDDTACTHDYDKIPTIERKEEITIPFTYFHYEGKKEERQRGRYSKKSTLPDLKERDMMEKGTEFHRLLELIDWNNREAFYQEHHIDGSITKLIEQFFKVTFLKDIQPIEIYREYEFTDEGRHGMIDLLIETENTFLIVDYKLKNIDSKSYDDQLNGYRTYLKKITNKEIKCYLYSIIDGIYREIK